MRTTTWRRTRAFFFSTLILEVTKTRCVRVVVQCADFTQPRVATTGSYFHLQLRVRSFVSVRVHGTEWPRCGLRGRRCGACGRPQKFESSRIWPCAAALRGRRTRCPWSFPPLQTCFQMMNRDCRLQHGQPSRNTEVQRLPSLHRTVPHVRSRRADVPVPPPSGH